MKRFLTISALLIAFSISAQQSANRFFYELKFKPKKDSTKQERTIAILDITDGKSIYQDYTVISQDSIIESAMEEMKRTQAFKDMSKMFSMPKFSYKIYKTYPDMKLSFVERIGTSAFGYDDEANFNWSILPEKAKIGEYNAQKATTNFGGRQWTAWFSTDLPFNDGPYKFHGLPGLIVKIEDQDKDYSWTLSGNKSVKNWKEFSYAEELQSKMMGMKNDIKIISKEKFEKAYNNFKQDPMAEARNRMPSNVMSMKMPGSDETIGEMVKRQEKVLKDFYNSNNNPIERSNSTTSKK